MRVRTGKVEINRDRAIRKTIGFNGGQRNSLDEYIRLCTNVLFQLCKHILETYEYVYVIIRLEWCVFCLVHDLEGIYQCGICNCNRHLVGIGTNQGSNRN